jgi:PAS domain S-box-containing protein
LAPAYRVATAADGQEGLDQALALRPDLVLSDLMMPRVDGEELLRALRGRREFDDVPVLLLTAKADDGLRVRLLAEGAQDCLYKPFRSEELLARVGRLVAERKRGEAKAGEFATLLRAVADAVSDALFVKDAEGRYLMINPAGARALGGPVEGVLGRTDAAFLPAEMARAIREDDLRVMAEGRARTYEEAIEAAGGRRTFLVTKAPYRDRDGRVAGVLGIARDVTDYQEAAAEVHRLNAELARRVAEIEALMEAIPAAVWIADDPACRRITGNRAAYELFRLPAGRNASKSAPDGERPQEYELRDGGAVVPPDELPMQRAAASGRAVLGAELDVVFPDGECRRIYGNAVPLFDERGAVRGCISTFLDITERQRLAEQLRQRAEQLAEADRRKDEFLAMLAHELRNPLAPIRNAAQVLRLLGPAGPELAYVRDVIERQVQHMARLVDDLLDVSRITRGKVQLRKEPIDLAGVLGRAVEAARPLLDARKHQLTVSVTPEPVRLEADPTRLAQVVANLLNNAAKYTEEGGRVWLSAETAGPELVLRVRDTGVGIPAEMLGKVFDLFTQVDRTLDRSQGGLGIGLTLVKALVEMHGGSARAFSGGPGQGSEFVVRLPLLPERRQRREAREEGRGAAPPSRRVLVIDDNVDAAESLALLLRVSGHEVRTAHDGPAGLEAALAFRPEVVLLDIGLPGMNGYEVARRLRAAAELREVLLVALTGYGQEEDRRRSREAGFDRHLVKPAAPDELVAVLAGLEAAAP